MIKTLIKKLATGSVLALIILLILLQLALSWMFNTENGTRWLLRHSVPLVPGELHYDNLEGTLLKGITFEGVHYQHGELALSLKRLSVAVDYYGLPRGWLVFRTLHLEQATLQLPAAAEPAAPKSTPLSLPNSLRLPFGIALLDGRANDSTLITADGSSQQLASVTLQELWMRRALTLGQLNIQYQQHSLQVSGDSELVKPYTLKAKAAWQAKLPATVSSYLSNNPETLFRGNANISGNLLALNISHQLRTPQVLDSTLTLNLFDTPLAFITRHRFNSLTLNLPGQDPLALSKGELDLTGDLHDYALELNTNGAWRDFKEARLSLQALGNRSALSRFALDLQQPETRLRARGALQFSPYIALDTELRASGIELQEFIPQQVGGLTSQLALDAHLALNNRHGDWRFHSNNLGLQGTLNQQPLFLSGTARYRTQAGWLNIRGQWADNEFELTGDIGDQLDLHSQFNLARPELFHAPLTGNLLGSLHLHGSRDRPRISGELFSQWLLYQRWKVQQLTLSMDSLGLDSEQLHAALRADTVLQDNRALLTDSTLQLSGSTAEHALSANTTTPLGPLAVQLQGSLDSAVLRWRGVISQFSQQPAQLPVWELEQPAPLLLSREQIALENFCLSDQHGQLCAALQQSATDTDLNLNARALSLRPLALLLDTGARFDGTLNASSQLSRRHNRWNGSAELWLEDASVALADSRDHPLLQAEEARTSIQVLDNLATLSSRFQFVDWGHIEAEAAIRLNDKTLIEHSSLNAQLDSLKAIQLFTPHLRNPDGHFNARFSAQGPLLRPQLEGAAQLALNQADIPAAGLTLKNGQLLLQANGTALTLSGQVNSGKGALMLDGSLDFAEGLPGRLAMTAQGRDVDIMHTPEVEISASPDIQLYNENRRLFVRGSVEVPKATVAPKQLPELAVRPSRDEIIINQSPQASSGIQSDVLVTLVLGRQVNFRGFGLEALLSGNVSFRQVPEQPFMLQGEVRIAEGRYRAYGQNLAIDDGLLFFQDQADNPAMDIRAYRKIPSAGVTVGVALTGTLQQPEARLYSDPAMEESEMMSWLVTGRGLETGSNSDNARIAQALALYGLQQGAGVTESLGEKLRLDEVSIGSNWENSDASLMLGKQINDRLYLRYAIGLFDAISTVMLRYTLNRRLHLEAQSNMESQSIDLIYQIER